MRQGMPVLAVIALLLPGVGPLVAGSDSIPAEGGEIRITPILHGSVQVEFGSSLIYVDPWSKGDYSGAPKADLILVTDTHVVPHQ